MCVTKPHIDSEKDALVKGQLVLLKYRNNPDAIRLGVYIDHINWFIIVYLSSSETSINEVRMGWDLFVKSLPKVLNIEDPDFNNTLYQENLKLQESPNSYEASLTVISEEEKKELLLLLKIINGTDLEKLEEIEKSIEQKEEVSMDDYSPIVNDLVDKWSQRQQVLDECKFFGITELEPAILECEKIFDNLLSELEKGDNSHYLLQRIIEVKTFFTRTTYPEYYALEKSPRIFCLNMPYSDFIFNSSEYKQLKKTYKQIKRQCLKPYLDDYLEYFRDYIKRWFFEHFLIPLTKEQLIDDLVYINDKLRNKYECFYYKNHKFRDKIVRKTWKELHSIKQDIQETEHHLLVSYLRPAQVERIFKRSHSQIQNLIKKLSDDSDDHIRGFPLCSCKYKCGQEDFLEESLNKLGKEVEIALDRVKIYDYSPQDVPPQVVYVLLALDEVEGRVGRNALSLILNGSKSKIVQEKSLDENPQYGKLSYLTQKEIIALIDHLINHTRFIHVRTVRGMYAEIPLLYLTYKGEMIVQASDELLKQSPDVKDWKVDEFLSVFKTSSIIYKKELVKSVLQYEKLELMSELVNNASSKDWAGILSILYSQSVPRSFIPVIFSLLLGGELNRRQLR